MTKTHQSDYAEALSKLQESIGSLDVFAESTHAGRLEASFTKTVCWCQGLSQVYSSNPARLHLAGAWSEIVNILALVPLCFYRQSVISMRIVLDEILAWSFYESHPVEFGTSMKDCVFWVGKDQIYDFHRTHSWEKEIQLEKLGVWSEFNGLYSELSRYIHAQTTNHMSLIKPFADVTRDPKRIDQVIALATRTNEATAKFLASLYQEAYTQFSPETQREIIKGWSNETIRGLRLSV